MKRSIGRILTLAAVLVGTSASGRAQEVAPFHANVRIVEQYYCYGDADIFTVGLRLEVKVTNRSQEPIYFLSNMVPFMEKIAATLEDAKKGKYAAQVTSSHYLTGKEQRPREIHVEPGATVMLQVEDGIPAPYKSDPPIPGTAAPGTHALQLVLSPEYEPSDRPEKSGFQESITTEPFLVSVPKNPTMSKCHRD